MKKTSFNVIYVLVYFEICILEHTRVDDSAKFQNYENPSFSSCVRIAKALARLRGCAGSPEPSLVAYVISTIIS